MTVGFDFSIVEQTLGSGLVEAACILAVLGFIIWNIKLALEKDE